MILAPNASPAFFARNRSKNDIFAPYQPNNRENADLRRHKHYQSIEKWLFMKIMSAAGHASAWAGEIVFLSSLAKPVAHYLTGCWHRYKNNSAMNSPAVRVLLASPDRRLLRHLAKFLATFSYETCSISEAIEQAWAEWLKATAPPNAVLGELGKGRFEAITDGDEETAAASRRILAIKSRRRNLGHRRKRLPAHRQLRYPAGRGKQNIRQGIAGSAAGSTRYRVALRRRLPFAGRRTGKRRPLMGGIRRPGQGL